MPSPLSLFAVHVANTTPVYRPPWPAWLVAVLIWLCMLLLLNFVF